MPKQSTQIHWQNNRWSEHKISLLRSEFRGSIPAGTLITLAQLRPIARLLKHLNIANKFVAVRCGDSPNTYFWRLLQLRVPSSVGLFGDRQSYNHFLRLFQTGRPIFPPRGNSTTKYALREIGWRKIRSHRCKSADCYCGRLLPATFPSVLGGGRQ